MKPSIPKGTRDFSATEIAKRSYIFNCIKKSFEKFGFEPIETPSFENTTTLMGKYGEEGDRLIFKILKSGDFLQKTTPELLRERDSSKLTPYISDKALRYDLTVPFARYVVQHFNELIFPFKRYQMQPVWRADRPQKGRFREFYQCDADVLGNPSLWQEIEFIQLYDDVFNNLGMSDISIKINHRKILIGLAEVIGAKEKWLDFTITLDKIDKIGYTGVVGELQTKGITEAALEKIRPLLQFTGTSQEKLQLLKKLLKNSKTGQEGVAELQFITEAITTLHLKTARLIPDLTLARGLNYYTGTILEVVADEVDIGSIGGGGRYDDLTGIFGLKNMSGMGISFGLDRIYIALEQLDLFDKVQIPRPKALFINFGNEEAMYAMQCIIKLRDSGISAEMYPDSSKIKKQMTYANKRDIPFVIMAGSHEIQEEKYTLRNMENGEQQLVTVENMLEILKK